VLSDAFVAADRVILSHPTHLWEDSAGCTGVVAVVDLAQRAATVAHVGDSRAIHFIPNHEPGATAMITSWQSNDHESTERAFGHRLRKASGGDAPTANPELNDLEGIRDGSIIVVVSDGIINAYPTPDTAVEAVASQLHKMQKARRNPVKRTGDAMPLLATAISDHLALEILREAERAANDHHAADPKRFSRDDMSVCLLLVEATDSDSEEREEREASAKDQAATVRRPLPVFLSDRDRPADTTRALSLVPAALFD